jgi:chemotaxis protein MotB
LSRRKKHAAHENHERWLISYADFITLLFAFFVVLFASSQTDKTKAKQVSEAVVKAFDGGLPPSLRQILGGAADDKGRGNAMMKGAGGEQKQKAPPPPDHAVDVRDSMQYVELLPSLQVLSKDLSDEIKSGTIKLTLGSRGLVITLNQTTFFPSGEDTIAPETYGSLAKIGSALRALPNPVRMEGHTDAIPIHTSRFHNNWELSSARAIAMLQIFADRYAVESTRMSIAGYADTQSVDSNDSASGRGRNRRVDVVILSQRAQTLEPAPNPVKVKP